MSNQDAPLFKPGLIKIAINDIEPTFVESFNNSHIRKLLTEKLLKYLHLLRSFNFNFDIWLDGSYCTHKPEPNDVDTLIVVDPSDVNVLSMEDQRKLKILLDNSYSKSVYGCDVYVVNRQDIVKVSYWRGWFGFERDGVTAKGIPFIEVRK
jgi:hypothetical protein